MTASDAQQRLRDAAMARQARIIEDAVLAILCAHQGLAGALEIVQAAQHRAIERFRAGRVG